MITIAVTVQAIPDMHFGKTSYFFWLLKELMDASLSLRRLPQFVIQSRTHLYRIPLASLLRSIQFSVSAVSCRRIEPMLDRSLSKPSHEYVPF